jgi:tyrosyl-tRNA synthetase
MDLIADLETRGLIHESTDRDYLRARVQDGPVGVYYGCDPTADSLHVGNLIGLIVLRRFQDAGHTAIALAGGATGMVGDPGGRSEERNLLDEDTLTANVASIKQQLGRIVDLSDPRRGVLVDNRDWTQPISLLEFLRDVGKHVTVNQMVARESVRIRLESEHGISFTEFSYMLLQANDYLWLHDHLGCEIQVGGSDQWGNIVSGVDLIRRKRQHAVHAFCWPLLKAADGSKLGKTTGARTWLDPDKTSPYQLRQYFMQVPDDDIRPQMLAFSLRPVNEVEAVLAEHASAPHRRTAQRALAHEVTALVHGESAADAADEAADVLFGGDPADASLAALEAVAREVPSSEITRVQLDDVVGVIMAAELASSKSDARRTLDGGGFRCNGIVIDASSQLSDHELLHRRYLLLQRGKKSHHLLEVFS